MSWLDVASSATLAAQAPLNPPVIANNYDDAFERQTKQQAFPPQAVQQPAEQQQALAPSAQGGLSYLNSAPPQVAYANGPTASSAPQPGEESSQSAEQSQPAAQSTVQQSTVQQSTGQQALAQPLPGGANGNQTGYGNSLEGSRSQRSQTRGGSDLPNRAAALQSYAQQSRDNQRSNLRFAKSPTHVVEGVSRTFWLGDRLLFARRVQIGDETVIQGCWLDWDALQVRLRAEVADLLPAVDFLPLAAVDLNRPGPRLASIPVQLAATMPAIEPAQWSPMRVSLLAAWSCLALAALAAGITLQRTLALSERRGAFVSAVTHELRTPLTTFRMYAEMLAEGMVPDAQQRQKYLNTLRVEADRLSHLVENVLQYARLERGRPGKRREPTTLAALVDHSQSRLADRAAQADLKLVVEHDEVDSGVTLATDIAAVEQILFNLVDNACKYAASAADKRLHLAVKVEPHRVQISVRDHGPGISPAGRKKLFQPFSKSVHEAANGAGRGPGPGSQRAFRARSGGQTPTRLSRRRRRGVCSDTAAVGRGATSGCLLSPGVYAGELRCNRRVDAAAKRECRAGSLRRVDEQA